MVEIDSAMIERLRRLSVADIATSLVNRGLRNVVMDGVVPVKFSGANMIGPAFTLRFIPARDDLAAELGARLPRENLQRRAAEECPPGHVLVFGASGDARSASAGESLLTRLHVRGCAGAVTDGGFRDTADTAKLDFPLYHSRPAPLPGSTHLLPVELNVLIGCGGVAVRPGDIICGDSDGVVVIPIGLVHEIADQAEALNLSESFAAEMLREGQSLHDLYPRSPKMQDTFTRWKASRPPSGLAPGGV